MSKSESLSATEALDRMFAVIRQEAAANPAFARRLLDAAGVTVSFHGTEAVSAADPVIVAMRSDQAAFREMFSTFSESDLKKMLGAYGLATAEEVKRVSTKPKKMGYVDLLWEGARLKAGKSA